MPSEDQGPAARGGQTLARRLGATDAAAIIVSNVIGSGIFITPAIIAGMVPHPLAVLAIWLVGGLLAFAGAMAYAELATLRPRSGGEYVYLREAFGPIAGFLTGWTSFVAGFSGAVAASAVGLAGYLGRFIPVAGDTTPLASLELGPLTLALSPQSSIALVAIAALSWIHVRGVGPGRIVQNVLAGLKVAVLLVFVALGLTLGRGSVEHFAPVGQVLPTSLLLALIPVMFSYSGWNAAAYVAEEISEPARNVPRALALGTVAVVLIYLAINVLYIYALPIDEMRGLQVRIVDAAAERLFGRTAGDALAVATIVILAASISAMVMAGPRVYFAMARDGLFFRAAARLHPRHRTPAVAIVAQAVWSGVLVLTSTFGELIEYTGFAVLLFTGIAVLALFWLRRTRPSVPRPFSAWGYPVAPAVFAIASLTIVANAIRESPATSGAGLAIILAGVPLFLLTRLGRRRVS